MKIKQLFVDLIWFVLACSGLIVFCTGCAMGPREGVSQTNHRAVEEVQAKSAEKLSRVMEGEKTPVRPVTVAPQPNVTLRGDGNVYFAPEPPRPSPDEVYREFLERQREREAYRETIAYEANSGAGASSDKASSWYEKKSIPLGWNLLLLALGVCAVLFAFNRIRQTSASFNALYEASDSTLAGWIREAREKAATSKAAEDMARHNSEAAELEAARGRLLKQKHSLKV
jgi:hypothetical protein